ncbi:MAG: lytic transglycosylase domain-containing protein [Alphaproteobacteria bacterium]|nr:lytic transglycosylase domain-containing protein [Alphaproteobacteria bacterium]
MNSLTRILLLSGFALCVGATLANAQLLSATDRQAYRTAFAAAKAGNWSAAERDAAGAKEPLPRKVLRWLEYRTGGSGASFSEIADFVTSNPEWPGEKRLRQRAEEALGGVPDSVLRDWFRRYPPITPYGKLREADLMIAAGQQAAGLAQIRDVWINTELSAFDEKSLLQRYPGVIRGEDNIKRLDRLVWDGLVESAHRVMPRVPQEYRLLADARLKLAAAQPGVEAAVAKVPAQLQNDPGLQFERLRWRRRKELYDAALEILLNPPRDLVRPAAWWTERQALARHALADGKPALAYKIVAKHGLTEGPAHAEAEFFAGWLALRFLHDPHAAYDHFVALYNAVKLPISLARGAYWAGRAAEEEKSAKQATDWFTAAAKHTTTYYGQLAAAKLGEAPRIAGEPKPEPAAVAEFHKRELVRALEMLAEIGDDDHVASFAERLSELAKTPQEHAMLAQLTDSIGRADLSIAVAKKAGYAGVPLINHGYPIHDLPPGNDVERPLLLAMTRQESAFDHGAVSSAGARGLMQLMPGTASQIAKARQIPFSASRLLTDPHYNLTLGRAYLEDLLDKFNGSYVLSIAAYNAGPARVREWIDNFGDPRTKKADVVDWVESIPFNETRNYVQRVLENLQVYRMRLGGRAVALSLVSDLGR